MYSNDAHEEGNESDYGATGGTTNSEPSHTRGKTRNISRALNTEAVSEAEEEAYLIDNQIQSAHSSRPNSHSQTRGLSAATRNSIPVSALPLVDVTRRLSLQINSSGNPVSSRSNDNSDETADNFHSLLRSIPVDSSRYNNKLPGGSRYFVNPVDESSRRNSTVFQDPLGHRPPSAFSWNDDHHHHHNRISERPFTSTQTRNIRTSRNRPVSSTGSHLHATGKQRTVSPKCNWPSPTAYDLDLCHLPPGGPDCYPGCGYSGLPCYVCSTKHLHDNLQPAEMRTRTSIFTILQPTHQSRGQQTFSSHFMDEDDESPSPCSRPVFKRCFVGCNSCWKHIRSRIHLPNSRIKQLGLTCFIVYLLLIIHIGVTRLLRDYHL